MSRIAEYLRCLDVKEIEGSEFARLLRFAYDEGRLAAILQRAGLDHLVLISEPSRTDRQSPARRFCRLLGDQWLRFRFRRAGLL